MLKNTLHTAVAAIAVSTMCLPTAQAAKSDLVLDLFDYRAGFVKVYSFFLYVGYAFASLFAPLRVGRFLIGLLIGIISFVTYFLSAFGLSFLWLMIGR